jgi:hypothetical protein
VVTVKEKRGMPAVRRAIRECLTQEDVVYAIAAELRAGVNGLRANDNGSVSGRLRKRDRDAKVVAMQGLRTALMFALGLPRGSHEELDAFLEDFKNERLAKPHCTCGAREHSGCFCEISLSDFLATGGSRRP